MGETSAANGGGFDARFAARAQAERYRDRFKTGKRVQTDLRERAALGELLGSIERVKVALDLPSGTGRLSPVLAERADRVILADSSAAMLELAREDLPSIPAEFLETDAERIDLADDSVSLIFCHRFFPHIYSAEMRTRIISEMRRVSDRYVLFSYYPPGFRSRFRWSLRSLLDRAKKIDQLATTRQFLDEMSACGFTLVKRKVLRRVPFAAFFLFERD